MIKDAKIIQCDICGNRGIADDLPSLPLGWGTGFNSDMHICSSCMDKVQDCLPVPSIKLSEVLRGV